MNFKKIFIFIIGTATMIGILAPILIYAYVSADQPDKFFCNKILDVLLEVNQRIAEKESKIKANRADIKNKIEERWVEQDIKLTKKRQEWDANRNEQIAELKNKFQDDSKKQAVINFEQEVKISIAVRREAIDVAINDFRKGVRQAEGDRQSAAENAKNIFKNNVNTAFNKAKIDCASGVDPETVRQNLKNDLIAAKEKYQNDCKEIEKISATLDQLIADREKAVEKSMQGFKTAMEEARAGFKAASEKVN